MSKYTSTNVFPLVACLFLTGGAAHAAVSSMEVAFAIHAGDTLTWFNVTDPSIQGTVSVSGLPANLAGNALAYDGDRHRLLFTDQTSGFNRPLYGVNLNGVTLVAGTSVNAGAANNLGTLTFSSEWLLAGAGYNNGSYYATRNNDDVLRKVDFDASGNIAGQSNIDLPGNATLRLGDLDFDANGGLWIAGENGSIDRIWYYPNGPVENGPVDVITPPHFYNGVLFNEAGTTLYGYSVNSGDIYGSINVAGNANAITGTGALTTLYTGAPFNQGGDLSSGFTMNVDIVPEPGSVALMGLLGSGLLFRRRRS